MGEFGYFEHDADIGIAGFGKTIEEAFVSAARPISPAGRISASAHALRLHAFSRSLDDEMHLLPDSQAFEAGTCDIFAVKIDFLALFRFDEPVSFVEEPDHDPQCQRLVKLDIPPLLPAVVLEAAPCRVECISQGDIDILGQIPVDDDLASGHLDFHPDVEQLALVLVLVRHFDDDMAAHDVRIELFEFVDSLADMGVDRLGFRNVSRGDLQRPLHDVLPGSMIHF